jgi:hypothetical protein
MHLLPTTDVTKSSTKGKHQLAQVYPNTTALLDPLAADDDAVPAQHTKAASNARSKKAIDIDEHTCYPFTPSAPC